MPEPSGYLGWHILGRSAHYVRTGSHSTTIRIAFDTLTWGISPLATARYTVAVLTPRARAYSLTLTCRAETDPSRCTTGVPSGVEKPANGGESAPDADSRVRMIAGGCEVLL